MCSLDLKLCSKCKIKYDNAKMSHCEDCCVFYRTGFSHCCKCKNNFKTNLDTSHCNKCCVNYPKNIKHCCCGFDIPIEDYQANQNIKHCCKCKITYDNTKKNHCIKCCYESAVNSNFKHCCECAIVYDKTLMHCCFCKQIYDEKTKNHCDDCHVVYDKKMNHCCKCYNVWNPKTENHCVNIINYTTCCKTYKNNETHCCKCNTSYYITSDTVHCNICCNDYRINETHCCDCEISFDENIHSHCCSCKTITKKETEVHCCKCKKNYNKNIKHCCKCKKDISDKELNHCHICCAIHSLDFNHCCFCSVSWEKSEEKKCKCSEIQTKIKIFAEEFLEAEKITNKFMISKCFSECASYELFNAGIKNIGFENMLDFLCSRDNFIICYHGTPTITNASSINCESWNLIYRGKTGQMYGRGEYFTTNIETAKYYAKNTGAIVLSIIPKNMLKQENYDKVIKKVQRDTKEDWYIVENETDKYFVFPIGIIEHQVDISQYGICHKKENQRKFAELVQKINSNDFDVFYQGDKEREKYSDEIKNIIKEKITSNIFNFEIIISNKKYMLNFKKMVQRNIATGYERKIYI